MELNDTQLQEFRDRCLKASVHGHSIALADLYMAALAQEVGQEVVPEDVEKASAAHLLALANEALAARAGTKKKVKKEKVVHTAPPVVHAAPSPKEPEAKVEKEPEAKMEIPPPPPAKEESKEPEAKVETKKVEEEVQTDKPKDDDKGSKKQHPHAHPHHSSHKK
jgi:hypothetical protein